MTNNRLQIRVNDNTTYDIVYHESFQSLPDEIISLGFDHRKMAIITDSNVSALYSKELINLLEPIASKVIVLEFKAGELSKKMETVCNLYHSLIEEHFSRTDLLIALGGGVVGDVCGFTAATYLRGVDFIQVPTTLLSQVDSSIGGKTGVDFGEYKNMVGAFKMPRLVYTNINALKTLDNRQFASGMGEIMKHGLIRNVSYYEWLISNIYEINDREYDILAKMVYESNIIKKTIVEQDPYEKGERALLNFGHTLGHAIEKQKEFTLLHGECVALGSVAAAYISYKRQYISKEDYYEIRDMFVPFNLPISIDHIDLDMVIQVTNNDKKMINGHINFILLEKLGKAIIVSDVTASEMHDALNEIFYDEDQND